tara:strand:+ start:6682 stop:7185 length:504 start_codon:yes stop_codon:yes gene_type:complete
VKHVQVFAIDNFDSLQKEALLQIPVSNEPVYGDYDVHGDPTKWDFDSKPYSDVTRRIITPAISKYCKSWECISSTLNTLWYHVYNKGGSYMSHTHTLANMTGVIHLLLEDERDCTTIVGYDGKIKEGEVVLFPSMTPHKSNPVHGKKIIIGFNWDMYSDMKTREEVQ